MSRGQFQANSENFLELSSFSQEFVLIVDAYKMLKRRFQDVQEEGGHGPGKRRRKEDVFQEY